MCRDTQRGFTKCIWRTNYSPFFLIAVKLHVAVVLLQLSVVYFHNRIVSEIHFYNCGAH